MLPVATPPNAIVFSAAKMNPVEMVNIRYRTFKQFHNLSNNFVSFKQMKAGWFMNLVCVIVICVLMETWGNVIFNSKDFPTWANSTMEKTENTCNMTEYFSTTVSDSWSS
jgi:sodium-dependent dicarboxylate transporter 2/3/5